MKKLITTICIILINILMAQKTTTSSESLYKNDVKWIATSQIIGRSQIAYERRISKQSSLGVGFGVNVGGGLKIKEVVSDKLYLSGLQYNGGIYTNLEYRYYFKNTSSLNGINGFYLGAYTTFLDRNANTQGWYIDDENNKNSFSLDANVKSFSFGIQAGYKLRVYKRFSMDFMILGPGYSNNTANLDFNTSINESTIDKLRTTINERYNFLSNTLPNISGSDDNRHYELKFGLPAFRYGIGIGYTF